LFTEKPAALLGSRCRACGRHTFPTAPDCPLCGAPDPETVSLSASGSLWAWTEVTTPPPGYRGEVPFGFGVVELPEGLRVITRLASPVAGYSFGQPMHLHLVDLGGGDGAAVLTWEFTP
jgi:uncharacterized OB-fold protein